MIAITDTHAKLFVLEDMLLRIEEGGVDALLEAGVSPELLDALRNRTTRDLIGVSKMIDAEIFVHVDANSFLNCFRRYDAMKRARQLQEYFVIHGATPEMLASLFKLSPSHVRHLRTTLRPGNTTAGRPTMPTATEREEIHQAWVEIGVHEKDIREQYYALHQRYSRHSISCLWATVNEYARLARKAVTLPSPNSVTPPAHS